MTDKPFDPTVHSSIPLGSVLRGHSPGQLIVQVSDACNATCPQCELRATNRFKRSRIAMDDMKRIIDAAADRGIQSLSFTGGEPFLLGDDLFELIRYAGEAGIRYTRTGTNAYFMRDTGQPDWEDRVRRVIEKMADTPLYTFWISLDSADASVHEDMRGLPGVVRGIERALPIFHEHGIFPAANLGVNRNTGGRWPTERRQSRRLMRPESFLDSFRRGFARFYRSVIDLGFTMCNACYPMSIQGNENGTLDMVYGASANDFIVRFTRDEKALLFRALRETIPRFADRLRIFTPLTSLYALERHYSGKPGNSYACRGGIDYFFVDAQKGHTYPCGFRGSEDLGRFENIDLKSITEKPWCRECDWECYRDPSELFGPVTDLFRNPLLLAGRFIRDRRFFQLWLRDIQYYRSANYFNGRLAPDFEVLKPFLGRGVPQDPRSEDLLESIVAGSFQVATSE